MPSLEIGFERFEENNWMVNNSRVKAGEEESDRIRVQLILLVFSCTDIK